jgi:hypothetical protein
VSAAPAGEALAAAATGLRLAATTERSWGSSSSAYACPFLKAGVTYHLFVLSLAGFAGAVSAGAAVLELHFPAGRPLSPALVVQPAAWGARALLCRTLTLGAPSRWGNDRCGHVHVLRHYDGAGFLLAAANAHGAQNFSVTHEVEEGRGGEARMLRTRAPGSGGGKCSVLDVLPPRHAQLLMAVAPVPGASGWGYSVGTNIHTPAEPGTRGAGDAPPGTLHAAIPFPLG